MNRHLKIKETNILLHRYFFLKITNSSSIVNKKPFEIKLKQWGLWIWSICLSYRRYIIRSTQYSDKFILCTLADFVIFPPTLI